MDIFGLTAVFTSPERKDYWQKHVPSCLIFYENRENQMQTIIEYQNILKTADKLTDYNIIIDSECHYHWNLIPDDLRINLYHLSCVKTVSIPNSAITYYLQWNDQRLEAQWNDMDLNGEKNNRLNQSTDC